MYLFWNEDLIREAIRHLDEKTGLSGAELPIRFDNHDRALGWYEYEGIRKFGFKRSFFLSSVIKDCEKIDLVRHEYAHYIVDATHLERYFVHGSRRTSHGDCWKFASRLVGAMPTRSHDSSAFSKMNWSSEKILAAFLATDIVQFDIRSFLKKWNRVPTDEEIPIAPSLFIL